MWDFSVGSSVSIIARTWPFLVLRTVVFGTFCAIFVILSASGAIIGHQLGPQHLDISAMQGATYGTIGGMWLAMAVLYYLREYALYLVKAGHIAVMVELLDGRPVPGGFAQIKAGSAVVRANFAEASALFVLDQMIKAALKSMDKFFKTIGKFIPFLAPILAFVQAVLTIAITYIDEMILAHIMRTRPANSWRAAADALVLYAQNGRAMLRNAFWLAIVIIVAEVAVAALVYFVLPVPEIPQLGPDGDVVVRVIAAAATVILLAHLVVEPFAVCTMLQAFNHVSDGQSPDPSTERELENRSDAFVDLKRGHGAPAGAFGQPAE